jgi:hypothetical protein
VRRRQRRTRSVHSLCVGCGIEPRNDEIAGAETVFMVERNMCNAVRRGIVVLPFAVMTRGKSRMRESCMYGSARGAPSNGRPYRDQHGLLSYGPNVDDMTRRAVAYIDRGRQVLRSAGAAADQIRAGDQPQDCEGARPRRPSDAARTRRRGDRVRRGATTAVGHSQAREADCEPANRACVTTSRRYCRACPRSWLQWLLLTKRPERKCSC